MWNSGAVYLSIKHFAAVLSVSWFVTAGLSASEEKHPEDWTVENLVKEYNVDREAAEAVYQTMRVDTLRREEEERQSRNTTKNIEYEYRREELCSLIETPELRDLAEPDASNIAITYESVLARISVDVNYPYQDHCPSEDSCSALGYPQIELATPEVAQRAPDIFIWAQSLSCQDRY